jgi:pimeloyl-ACP methyl ester carboxylesterase
MQSCGLSSRASRLVPTWLAYLVLTLLVLYLGLMLALALAQTRLLFPAHLVTSDGPVLPASAERLAIDTPDGERLAGLRIGPRDGRTDAGPRLLGFGGNAWNAGVMALYLHKMFPETEVVVFYYRGYPPSTGRPSAADLMADALVIFDHLERADWRPTVAVGFSIGAGVAAYLARHRSLAGLLLVTPFDSLAALARDHFPWAPVGLLLRHRMPVSEFMHHQSTPTALIAAGRDTIVPPRRTEPLRRAIPNLVFDMTIAETGDNDLYDHPRIASAMREALSRVRAVASPS